MVEHHFAILSFMPSRKPFRPIRGGDDPVASFPEDRLEAVRILAELVRDFVVAVDDSIYDPIDEVGARDLGECHAKGFGEPDRRIDKGWSDNDGGHEPVEFAELHAIVGYCILRQILVELFEGQGVRDHGI
jgi:hypothetical protein